MARHFKEEDIDEFRECFSLYARSGSDQIRTLDQLTVIMRSLGMSPTISELKKYFKEKGGVMNFPDFLDVMHQHGGQQNVAGEILAAFRATDPNNTKQISTKQLRHTLLHWGERLSTREVDQIFREANINPNGTVRYEDFTKIVSAPVPDYY
uniref:Calmodulin-like protein 4 n=1 Tax=Hirondellea gigas TaxID=1518452 RepID=A0A2P2I4N4_9CRUS